MDSNLQQTKTILIVKYIAMSIFILLPFVAFYFGMQYQKSFNKQEPTTFEECITQGNPVQESYPSICVTKSGRHFIQPITSTTPMEQTVPADNSTQQSCENFGGKWLAPYNECEGLDQTQCQEVVGTFSVCASPCRHDPNAEVCIQTCASVCQF